jgi:hypothetical protein
MARIGASEEQRIAKLHDALRRAKELYQPGERIGHKAMCGLLGITHYTLREWLEDPQVELSGAFVRGGRGHGYEFDPVLMIWVLLWFWERKRSDRVLANAKVREAIAGKIDDAPGDMTMREVRDAMQVSLQLLTAEKEAGELVKATEAASTYRAMVTAMRDTLLGSPQRLDPTNAWPTEFREMFDNALSDCLVLLREAGQEALSQPDATVPKRADESRDSAGKRKAAGRSSKPRAKRDGTAATA